MGRIMFLLRSLAAIASVSMVFTACGGSNSGGISSEEGTSTGSVAFYVTDDMSLDYSRVQATINRVQLLHTNSDAACDLLPDPQIINIADLSSMLQLLNVSECPSGDYNRIKIDFSEYVELTDLDNKDNTCLFRSYKNEHNHPNVLQCSDEACSITMNGAVNVLSNKTGKLALDFDLKKFEVEGFNTSSCLVTMKVAPLSAAEMEDKYDQGYEEGIAGDVSDMDIDQSRFTLTSESGSYTVHYHGREGDGIHDLLNRAAMKKNKVIVETPRIDPDARDIILSDIGIAHPKKPLARNIIVMISDGWGFNHLQAASYYEYGKDARQIFNRFPFNVAMSTHMAYNNPGDDCYDHGYDPEAAWSSFDYLRSCATDSAAAATALSTGVKTYEGAIGVDLNKERLINVIEAAEGLGKATGVVSSVPFSHATPAAFVAHNEDRNNFAEIAREMIHDSSVDVIMGTGHPFYDSNGMPKGSGSFQYVGGQDTWDALVAGAAGGDADGDGVEDPWHLIQTRDEFQAFAGGSTPGRVIGIPRVSGTLQQGRSGDGDADPYAVPFIATVPSLEEMTSAALNILDEDPDGLFLMIEGGAVDWAGHSNQSGRMIEEQIDFERAVEAVVAWVKRKSNWGETLLIVTGDHETGYLTGPGSDPSWEPIVNHGAGVLPGMEWHSDSHTNSLMVLSAKGDAARFLHRFADAHDPVRGPYIDNTEVGQILFRTLGPLD